MSSLGQTMHTELLLVFKMPTNLQAMAQWVGIRPAIRGSPVQILNQAYNVVLCPWARHLMHISLCNWCLVEGRD